MSSSMRSRKRKLHEAVEAKFYAVRAGKKPGVYRTWPECQQMITGFKGANYKAFLNLCDAQDYIAGKSVKPASEPTKWYGVAVGHNPGVYTEWAEASQQIRDVKGPRFKKFATRKEAEEFVRSGGKPVKDKVPEKIGEAEVKAKKKTKPEESVDFGVEDDPSFDFNLGVDMHVAPPRKKSRREERDGERLIIYTDGSARGNGKVTAQAGIGVYFGENDPRNLSEALPGQLQTNQRAELHAILRALQTIPTSTPLQIRTDSNYSINCVTLWYRSWEKNAWKTSTGGNVVNRDLVEAVRHLLVERERVGRESVAKSKKGGTTTRENWTEFIWVKGHSGDVGNVGADALAVAGALRMR